jgi:hypothetical protein
MRLKAILTAAAFLLIGGWGMDAAQFKAHVELLPYDIVGVALYPDGETPAEGLPIRVWDLERRKFIFRSETDAEGVFRVPRLETGKCHLFVGQVKVNLQMLARTEIAMLQHHDIVVVLPRRMVIAQRPEIQDLVLYNVILAPTLISPPPETKVISP